MKQRNRSQMSVAEIPFEIWCFLQCKRPQDPIPRVHPPMFNLLAPWQGPSSFQKKQQQKSSKISLPTVSTSAKCYVSKISFRCNCMSTISNLRLGRVNLHRLHPQKTPAVSTRKKYKKCMFIPTQQENRCLPSIHFPVPTEFFSGDVYTSEQQPKKGPDVRIRIYSCT